MVVRIKYRDERKCTKKVSSSQLTNQNLGMHLAMRYNIYTDAV